MHDALRTLPSGEQDLPEELDVLGWEGPLALVITLHNVDVPTYDEHYKGVTALLLDAERSLYPIKERLKEIGYEYVRGVHGQDGVDRWMRVVTGNGAAPALEKEVAELLAEEGWRAESHEADAATWGADE